MGTGEPCFWGSVSWNVSLETELAVVTPGAPIVTAPHYHGSWFCLYCRHPTFYLVDEAQPV